MQSRTNGLTFASPCVSNLKHSTHCISHRAKVFGIIKPENGGNDIFIHTLSFEKPNDSSVEACVLVTFTTEAYSDITMFGDMALAILKMMGHSATIPGAILAADVPVALSRLTAAIAVEKAISPNENKGPDESGVSMANRALPLINLLSAAAKANCNVMWS
jgi:cold shock CspA family protein